METQRQVRKLPNFTGIANNVGWDHHTHILHFTHAEMTLVFYEGNEVPSAHEEPLGTSTSTTHVLPVA